MNDTSLIRLKIAVEKTVRPLPARQSCKRRMRQEMLAHLVAVHEQEMARLGDDGAAADEALKRFGDPREVSMQLLTSLRWPDRVGYRLDRIFDPGAGESPAQMAARVFSFMLLGYAALLIVMLPVLLLDGRQYLLIPILRIAVVTSIVAAVLCCLLMTIPVRLGRILYGGHCQRPLISSLPCIALSFAVLPVLAFIADWGATADLTAGVDHLLFSCLISPAAPAIFLLIAKPLFEEIRYRQEWHSLDID
jgi:hypothetical protein